MAEDDLQEFPEGHATEGYVSCGKMITQNSNGTTTHCFKPFEHSDGVHEDYNGNTVVDAQ